MEKIDEDYTSISFDVYEIVGEENGKPLFNDKKGNFDTTNTKLAEKYLHGFIKWDSCSHFYFGDEGYLHLCGVYNIKKHCELLEYLYKRNFELKGEPPMDDENWD